MPLESWSCLLDLHNGLTVSCREMKGSGDISTRRIDFLGKGHDKKALCCLEKLC